MAITIPNFERRIGPAVRRLGAEGAVPMQANAPRTYQANAQSPGLNLGPGFAGAALAAKKRDLAVAQAQAAGELTQSDLARQYLQATQNLESGYEGRGILKSGEANTGRVALGAEEKAARARALMNTENQINQANLEYASALAAAQAAQAQAAPVQAQQPGRSRRTGRGGSSGSSTSTTTAPSTSNTTPSAQPAPRVTNTPVPIRSVGGRIVRPGDTPSETTGRGSRPPVRAPYAPKQPTNQFGRIRGGM